MNDPNKDLSDVMAYSHLGITFIITVGIFLVGGYYLDKWLCTKPWIFAFSVFPGLASGIYLLYKEIIVKNKDKKS